MPVRKIEFELPATNSCLGGDYFGQVVGKKQYEITNHLGNVLATVSDRRLSVDNYSYTSWSSGTKYSYDGQRNIYYQDAINGTFQRTLASSDNKTDWYTADVIFHSDYYAYGEQQHGRFGGVYRYDFNAEEYDPENLTLDLGARIYNSRLGRMLSRDPREGEYAWQSTYAYYANSPLWQVDVDGAGGDFDPPTPGSVAFWDYRVNRYNTTTKKLVANANYGHVHIISGKQLSVYSVERSMLAFYKLPSGGKLEITFKGTDDFDWNNDVYKYTYQIGSYTATTEWTRGLYEYQVELKAYNEEVLNEQLEFAIEQTLFMYSVYELTFDLGGIYDNEMSAARAMRHHRLVRPTSAAKTGNNIALGLGDDLFKFAETKGFQTYRNFSTGFQQDKILSAINNTSNNLHFNLTGFSRYQFSKFNPANPVGYRNITNWELHTILNNPNALQRTTFYRFSNGSYNVVPNPFLK